MTRTWRIGLLVAPALVAGLAAQQAGGFGGDPQESVGGVRPLTRFELFANKLKLDKKSQVPLATSILQETAQQAGPVGKQMLDIQNQLVTALLADASDAALAPLLQSYTAAAAKMTGHEAGAFEKIHAQLKPNQQSGGVEAFDMMGGWFQPPSPSSGRGGRGGASRTRMDILIDSFTLTKDQQQAIKTLMNDAQNSAAPIRDGLVQARPAIASAIQTGKERAEIDSAVNAYATRATSMAVLEMRTLARLMQTLTPEQRANQPGIRAAFYLLRSAFIGKRWDEPPNPDRGY